MIIGDGTVTKTYFLIDHERIKAIHMNNILIFCATEHFYSVNQASNPS